MKHNLGQLIKDLSVVGSQRHFCGFTVDRDRTTRRKFTFSVWGPQTISNVDYRDQTWTAVVRGQSIDLCPSQRVDFDINIYMKIVTVTLL